MSKWSLNQKIWAIIGLLIVAYVTSQAFALKEMLGIRDDLNGITTTIVRRDQLTSEIKDNQRLIVQAALEAIILEEPAKLDAVSKKMQDTMVKQDKDIAEYEVIASEKGKGFLTQYKSYYGNYLNVVKASKELSLQNKNKEAADTLYDGEHLLVKMREYLKELNDLSAVTLKDKSQAANENAMAAVTIVLIMASLSITIAIMISFMVLRSLSRAIAGVVQGLSDNANQVTSAATQIASASEQLSQATTEQAASLEETAASVEEMNSMIAKNSENANSAASTSGKSQDVVASGQKIIERMIASMEAINKSSEGMAEAVKVIEQIDKKTKVINEIVNKTELLSFNASVEAARAGEHGKGFAVVAEEVGNLARMSGAAAEEIATLLEDSIRHVNLMVGETKKNVEAGTMITKECGQVFESVVRDVNKVSGMANEIASASQEQAHGCSEITKAMNQLDQMTQQNAATSEECASAAEELSAQADSLKNSVSLLILTVNGGDQRDVNFSTQAVQPRVSSTQRKQPGKVIKLHSPSQPAMRVNDMSPKKIVGSDMPAYDHDGFKDV